MFASRVITLALICFHQTGCSPAGEWGPELPEVVVDQVPVEHRSSAAASLSDFGGRMLARLHSEQVDRNLLISPSSLYSALAMLSAGAKGETQRQITELLAFRLEPEQQHEANGALEVLLRENASGASYSLEIASRLWGQSGFALEPDCVSLMKRAYGAGLVPLDFKAGAEASRAKINTWVSDRTQGRIEDLMPPGSIDALTRLVITTAVYFKGVWKQPFAESATRSDEFHRRDGSPVRAEFMHLNERARFAELGDVLALELPYEGEELNMLLLLPNELDEFIAELDHQRLEELSGALRSVEVQIALPRFRFSSSLSVGGTLAAMGVSDVFDPARADLSGLSAAPDLYVQAVVHKTFIEVNEEGTEAAGATGISLGVTSAPSRPAVFRADRPFLFAIRHAPSGALLFLGRVADPVAG